MDIAKVLNSEFLNSISFFNFENAITAAFYADKNHDVAIDSLSKNGRWGKRKKAAIKNVQNIVNKLLDTYANRENSYREIILPDNDENIFIDEFPYLETKDQINAWNDIKDDYISSNLHQHHLQYK